METLEKITVRLIANTGTEGSQRLKRQLSIFEIAEDILWLKNQLGNMKKVAETVTLSEGMLQKFLRVFQLSDYTKELVKQRKIDSVEVVNQLARYPELDQSIIADLLIKNEFSNQDFRILSPLKKQFPDEPIEKLIEKIKKSKDIKVSVIQFNIENLKKSKSNLEKDLIERVGQNEFIGISILNNIGLIKITKKGELLLREYAKAQKQTLQELTYKLLEL